jgi:hypothetical protein
MTTNSTSYNASIRLNSITNDDTITNLLVIDNTFVVGLHQVKSRNSSTLSVANQSLNTTNNVTFNSVTSSQDLAQTNGTMTLVMNNITIAQAQLTTTTSTATTIYSLSTVADKNYTIFAEVSMIDGSAGTVAGDAAFIQTKRVTNTAGVLDIGTVESFLTRNGNTGTSNVQFIASGSTLNIQVIGIASNTNYWTIFLRIIRSP